MSFLDKMYNNKSLSEMKRKERVQKRKDEIKARNELVKNTIISSGGNVDLKSFGDDKKGRRNSKNKNTKNNNKKVSLKNTKFKDLPLSKKLLVIFLWMILAFAIIGLIAGGYLMYLMFGINDNFDDNDFKISNQNTEVFDREGNVIATLSKDEKRKIVPLSGMSKYVPLAYVSIEDERFYNHHGVDFKRTLGASVNYIVHRGNSSYGGSTITQQLVKNMTKDDQRNWQRKIREFGRSFQIENKLSKDEILELYLNIIYVGGESVHGIALGSDYYFDKDPKDLTLAEAAFLAGINNAPATYSPYLYKQEGETDEQFEARQAKRMEKIKNRTLTVLGKMKELKKINDQEYNEAVEQVEKGIEFKQGTKSTVTVKYSNTVDAAIDEATEIIMKQKDVKRDIAELALLNGGYKIYTTQDSRIQEIVETQMRDPKRAKPSKLYPGKHTEAATVILDHKTGEVVASAGGLGDDVDVTKGDWNRVTRTRRQVGSTMKVLGVVAPGLESRKITAASVFNDSPLEKFGNFSGNFEGLMNIRTAIEMSENIPNLRAVLKIGPDYVWDFLKKIGIQVEPEDKSIGALALGGLQKGTTVLDMAGAYGMIANDGQYIKPTFIKSITDSKGKEIYKHEVKSEKVLDKNAAFITKNVMTSTVTGPRGTAKFCAIPGFEVAAKSGTTNDYIDRWMCGFTNKYTAAVWYGFDFSEEVPDKWPNPAGLIWKDVMLNAHKGLEGENFEVPDGVVKVAVCKDSGLLPSDLCKRDPRGNRIYEEWFIKGTEPKDHCKTHVEVEICKKTGLRASDRCRPENKEKRVFITQDDPKTLDFKYSAPKDFCTNCDAGNATKEEEKEETDQDDGFESFRAQLSSTSASDSKDRLRALVAKYKPAYDARLSNGEKAKYARIVDALNTPEEKPAPKPKPEEPEEKPLNTGLIAEVNALIAALPNTATPADKEVIAPKLATIRAKYANLTPDEKAKIVNYAKVDKLAAQIG